VIDSEGTGIMGTGFENGSGNGSAAGGGVAASGGARPGVAGKDATANKHTAPAGVTALIVAGGSGSRFTGSFIPKQFVQVNGKPILAYVLESYQNLSQIDEIVLVINRRYEQLYYDIVDTYGFFKVRKIVPGGKSRQTSAAAGLAAIEPCEIIVVQDGVRPFTAPRLIMEAVEMARRVGGANVAVPTLDTIVEVRDGFIERIPNRAFFYNGQAPQAFRYELLMEAHRKAEAEGITDASDDAQLVLQVGGRVGIVQGSYANFKITTYEDFLFASALVEQQRPKAEQGAW
jgi:2-C-methyl-D-erythritol 4-phosphate cytidylyltransferase